MIIELINLISQQQQSLKKYQSKFVLIGLLKPYLQETIKKHNILSSQIWLSIIQIIIKMSSLQTSSISSAAISNGQIQLKKLKQQNIQLHKQVFELQTQVNQVLCRQQQKKLKNLEVQKQLTSLYGQQLDEQQKKIKRLKQQVYYLKSSNAKLNIQYLNKEQDQLALLINERDQLQRQKQLLKNNIKDKKNVLDKNNPLQTHKIALQTQYNQTKKHNTKKLAQIVQIQRQLRKFHFIAQTVKNTPPQNTKNQPDITSLQMQFHQLAHQLSNTQKEINQIENKWKPSIDALDTEYFTLSNQEKTKKTQLQALIKKFKLIQHRSKSLRDQADILQDRNRLSKIVTSTSSAGFTQSLHKKNSIKESQSFLQQTDKKARIKSDFIFKEFQNLKVKQRKIKKQSDVDKPTDIILNQNKTFDLGLKKQTLIKSKQKQGKMTNRSLTQAQLNLKKIEQKPKPQSPLKQTQLKITQQSKSKIKRNQSIKSKNQKSQKQISFVEPKVIEKVQKRTNQNKKQQIKSKKLIKSPPKALKSQQKLQLIDQLNLKQRKKEIQTQKLTKIKAQTKGTKQNVQKNQGKNKLPQKSELSLQKSQINKFSINSVTENRNQVAEQKLSNQNVLIKSKSKPKIEHKPLTNQEQIYMMTKNKSSEKVDPQNVTQINAKSKEGRQKVAKGRMLNESKTAEQPRVQQKIQINKKEKKAQKELKESIHIKKEEKQIFRVDSKQKAQKKVRNKSLEKIKQESKQSEKFEIRLENKKNKNIESEKKQEAKQSFVRLNPKSIESNLQLEPRSPKGSKSKKKKQQSLEVSSQIKEQVIEQFKPYLIKRKRQGGALKFQNKDEQSRQKANLLQLIEKQSIGVGIQ